MEVGGQDKNSEHGIKLGAMHLAQAVSRKSEDKAWRTTVSV